MQTGESVVQAKVFKAHAVPQGLCENLIDALKLLANQQEDGDGLLQNIVTNLGKGSRKGLTDGLRDFIQEFRKGGSDVTIRESPDELALRAEEVNTSKAYIDVNHIEPEGWALSWLMLSGMLSARRCPMGIEGEDWEDMCDSYKAMSKALGVKITAGGSEGKSPVGHGSSQGQRGKVL